MIAGQSCNLNYGRRGEEAECSVTATLALPLLLDILKFEIIEITQPSRLHTPAHIFGCDSDLRTSAAEDCKCHQDDRGGGGLGFLGKVVSRVAGTGGT